MLKNYLREIAYYTQVVKELIFPRRCAVCGEVIDTAYLCDICRKSFLLQIFERFMPREEYLAGQAEPMPQDVLSSVMLLYKYDGVLKDALHQIKFMGDSSLLPLLREQAESALPSAKLRWLSQYDIITCIPASSERRQQRGFDVPEEIFAPLLDQRGGEYSDNILLRVRHTAPLFELQPMERRSELTACFALYPQAKVQGKRVLLCDDIYTTGSTMAEAAKILLENGAKEVHGLAFTASSDNWEVKDKCF